MDLRKQEIKLNIVERIIEAIVQLLECAKDKVKRPKGSPTRSQLEGPIDFYHTIFSVTKRSRSDGSH